MIARQQAHWRHEETKWVQEYKYNICNIKQFYCYPEKENGTEAVYRSHSLYGLTVINTDKVLLNLIELLWNRITFYFIVIKNYKTVSGYSYPTVILSVNESISPPSS